MCPSAVKNHDAVYILQTKLSFDYLQDDLHGLLEGFKAIAKAKWPAGESVRSVVGNEYSFVAISVFYL